MPETTTAVAQKNDRYVITTKTGEKLTLSLDIVKKQLAGNANITDSEFLHFFQLCKVNKVNPFLGEAYIVKFEGKPAQVMVAEKVLEQAAEANPYYAGMKHGIVVTNSKGITEERSAEYLLQGEVLVAAWAEVYRKDRGEITTKNYAMLSEYSKGQATWKAMPVHMLIKCAKAAALREAFPNLFDTNVYSQEESQMANFETIDVSDQVEKEVASEKKNTPSGFGSSEPADTSSASEKDPF